MEYQLQANESEDRTEKIVRLEEEKAGAIVELLGEKERPYLKAELRC